MKEIIALQQYTDKYVSFYEGEIRNIEDGIADKLIEQGIVAEHGDFNPSGGEEGEGKNNNIAWIIKKDNSTTPASFTLRMSVDEIAEAAYTGKPLGIVTDERENGSKVIGGQISTTYTIFAFPDPDEGGYLILYTFPSFGFEGELHYYYIDCDGNIVYNTYRYINN